MEELIEETKRIAKERFQAFGFGEGQIEQLLASGERDMKKELANLREILLQDPCDPERLNSSLHALKGLFLNMGNEEVAEKLSELRHDDNNTEKIAILRKLTNIDR
jgi:hypothetical protein